MLYTYKALKVHFRLSKSLLVQVCRWVVLDVLLGTWVRLRLRLNAGHLLVAQFNQATDRERVLVQGATN